jgi:hypothetical protein
MFRIILCATFRGAEESFWDRKLKFIERLNDKFHFASNREEVDLYEELSKCPNCASL